MDLDVCGDGAGGGACSERNGLQGKTTRPTQLPSAFQLALAAGHFLLVVLFLEAPEEAAAAFFARKGRDGAAS